MGKAFAGSFCNIFMNSWEKKALDSFSLKPDLWIRYQDDIFGIWAYRLTEFHNFVDHLNRQHPNIKLTPHIGRDSIPFLDLEVSLSDNKLRYNLYFKPTDSHFT